MKRLLENRFFTLMVAFNLMLWCAACGGSSSTAPPPSHGFQVIRINGVPGPAELSHAKEEFGKGAIIIARNATTDQLDGWFGINLERVVPTERSGGDQNAVKAGDSLDNVLHLIAFRATPQGALHSFQGYSSGSAGADDSLSWQKGFATWKRNEGLGSQLAAGAPSAGAWTELQVLTSNGSDGSGNSASDTIAIYRLNDINTKYDWYMFVQQPQENPNFTSTSCGLFTDCGWYTYQRTMTIAGPFGSLFQYGPTGTISSSSAGFSVGGGLNGDTPSASASYSMSWSQASVTTLDQSIIPQNLAHWIENFTGQTGGTGTPPGTSIGSFYSGDAAIFQVPEGSMQFNAPVMSSLPVWEFHHDATGAADFSSLAVGFSNLQVNAPVISISPGQIRMSTGAQGSRAIKLVAQIPDSSQGLAWTIGNIPTWLSVSQASGSGSATITISVVSGTAAGTTGSIDIQTSPPYGAPAVEKGPLQVQITVMNPATGILVTGGQDQNENVLSSAEVFNPATMSFAATVGSMQSPREVHTETVLDNGQVLLTGGNTESAGFASTQTAELFDPDTGLFTFTGSMNAARAFHSATRLLNGMVLIAGGRTSDGSDVNSAELYNPATGTFSATGNMTVAREQQIATLLCSGQVLITGGVDGNNALASAEIYNPNSGAFTAAGDMSVPRVGQTATVLPNCQVLIAGGYNYVNTVYNSSELFNPSTSKFTLTGSMNTARAEHTATSLANGQVLVAGGFNSSGAALNTAEIFNPDSASFTPVANNMNSARSYHTATLLTHGPLTNDVVLAGGGNNSAQAQASAEYYDPSNGSFVILG
ncbi:MAG: Kelch repeat-containing protein, partial [Candidatus Binataceae bacterium]